MPTFTVCNEIKNKVIQGPDPVGEPDFLPNIIYIFFPDKEAVNNCKFSVFATVDAEYKNGSIVKYLI